MLETLRTALKGRYEVDRELGRGGMATVFLAKDLRHDRPVAIKVLRSELAAALGPERFQQEIRVAAGLSHPNILALYDSGEANGLLYYVMPFVEGESLGDRLARETQLSIDEALAITRQVAQALHYAHERGIVHRDVKPDNIMLQGDQALVADFGIARAVDSLSQTRLTSTGIVMGTPAYMSPEQAAAESDLDARSDVYSLACVLYEMLSGETPFRGTTARAMLARHAVEPPPSVRVVRPTVPDAVQFAIVKAMAKLPADRYATAYEFAEALAGQTGSYAVSGPRRRVPKRIVASAAAAALAVIAITTVLITGRSADVPPSDSDLIAVMPFQTASALDPSLGALSEGMLELFYTRLGGGGALRAVSPSKALSAFRRALEAADEEPEEAGLRAAAELGAGRLLTGNISSIGGRLFLRASLVAVPSGEHMIDVQANGVPDSLLALVDQLAARLLVRSAGESDVLLSQLLTTDLGALQDYLDGQAAYNRGEYVRAVSSYRDAMAKDSTFALAALGMAAAEDFLPVLQAQEGLPLAWRARERLGARDAAYLTALAGPRYPAHSSFAEQITAWQQATHLLADRKEPWYQMGNLLLEWGAAVGLTDAQERAQEALEQAVELDSAFTPALGHLLEIAARRGDTAAVRRIAPRVLAGGHGDLDDYYRWRVALALGDSATLRGLRLRFAELEPRALDRILGVAQLDGVGLEDALPAAESYRAQSRRPNEVRWASDKLRSLALNRGRPREAMKYDSLIEEIRVPEWDRGPFVQVIHALYWGGDTARARANVERRAPIADAVQEPRDPFAREYFDICAVNLWRVSRGDLTPVRRSIRRLVDAMTVMDTMPRQRGGPRGDLQMGHIPICSALLDAQLAAAERSDRAPAALAHLDSLMRSGPQAVSWITVAAHLSTAWLFEARGDIRAALAAVRRRSYQFDRGTIGLSTFLREEGRLAAMVGDTAAAIRAYDHYLRLREKHEPAVAHEVAQVRQELAGLVREP